MLSYTFRVMVESENNTDVVYRDIKILEDNNFEAFHHAILDAYGFNKTELASFYLCNENWDKLREIALFDMNLNDNQKEILVMSETKIGQIVRNEDQRLIYLYDFLNNWNFYIEVIEIADEKNLNVADYPKIIKTCGKGPDQSSRNNLIDINDMYGDNDAYFSEGNFEDFDDIR